MDSNVSHWEGCRHTLVNRSHRTQRIGGIITWFCKHGVCYCRYIHKCCPFWSMFFPVARKIVDYDFACAVQDYCLNRQPIHLQNTILVVDMFHWYTWAARYNTWLLIRLTQKGVVFSVLFFHWYNHVCCARSYRLSLCPDYILYTAKSGLPDSQAVQQCLQTY